MEAEIDQALGDILVADAAPLLNAANVDDAFMRHPPVRTGVEDRELRRQPRRHVVRRQDGGCGGGLEPVASHHPDIGVGDRQDARRPVRRGADRPFAAERRARKEVGKMRRDADRPHARSASAMRNAERLVKVQVADIGPEIRQRAMPDQRVQVRPVDIDLSAGLMDDVAQLGDGFLEHAVG